MFKYTVVVFAVIACAAAKPGLLGAPFSYHAPAALVAAAPAPFVTATSNQVIARNYNGIAHAPIVAAAPVVAPLAAARLVAPHVAAYSAPLVAPHVAAYSAPLLNRYAAAAAPLAFSSPLAYSSPLAANYLASPYTAPYAAPYSAAYAPTFGAPLHHAASRYVL